STNLGTAEWDKVLANDNSLFVQCGQGKVAGAPGDVVAFGLDGKPRWEAKDAWIETLSRDYLFLNNRSATICCDAQTGRQSWSYANTIGTQAIVANNLIVSVRRGKLVP